MNSPVGTTSHSRSMPPALLVGLVLLAAVLLAGSSGPFLRGGDDTSGKGGRQANVPVVDTLVIEQSDSSVQAYSYRGVIRARRSLELGFDRAGRIAQLMASRGDTLAENALVAELDTQRLAARQESLQAARDRAAASLQQLDPATAVPGAAEMQATIAELRAELNQLSAEVVAGGQTAQGQPVSDPLQRRLQAVSDRVEGLNASQRQAKINRLRESIAELDGQLADVALELDGCQLTAPFAGVVAAQYVEQGAVVSPGMPVVRLIAPDAPEMWVGLPADLAATVEDGRNYPIAIDDREYQGVLVTVLPEVDQATGTRSAIFRLDTRLADELVPGDVARVELKRRSNTSGFWLPVTALIRQFQGLWSVYVVEPRNERHVVSRRYVEILHLASERVFVRGTLDAGDRVISDGTHRVVPGQLVRYRDVPQARGPSLDRMP